MAITVKTWGTSDASKCVFLVHGMAAAPSSWDTVATKLADQGYYVVAPALPGHGGSPFAPGSDYSVAGLANALLPSLIAEAEHGRPIVIIGHSLGGNVVLALLQALKSSTTATSKTLLSTSLPVVLVDPPLFVDPAQTPEDHRMIAGMVSQRNKGSKGSGEQRCEVKAIDAIFEQNSPWSFAHLLADLPKNVSLLLLAADPAHDAKCKLGDVAPYIQGANGIYEHISCQVVKGVGHCMHLERPDDFIHTVSEFLSKGGSVSK
ncbi:alpha beta-hydrolase [Coniophora puteana RWD-64-598 SS2]|uniref:Alpha beta-hydrolase n=1 Tax=Coniophora puteana (strain RWD-64-598) TaxID=741705 RepID=A0A5M3MWK1_CONPW|nr:alpha beta-hydrolase [Coniophora puteana RWD-64-598 SS2]EIW83533.1 alpha beta-hydrolase [Coniophora puteana RWD-64-598 SS2]